MRGQRQVEHVGLQETHSRPARQRYEQPEKAADCEKYYRNDRIGFDQLLCSQIDLEAGCRAGSELCCFCHVSSFLFDNVDLADHVVVTDPAKFVTYDAVLASLVRLDRHDHVVARVHLDVDVDRLQ